MQNSISLLKETAFCLSLMQLIGDIDFTDSIFNGGKFDVAPNAGGAAGAQSAVSSCVTA